MNPTQSQTTLIEVVRTLPLSCERVAEALLTLDRFQSFMFRTPTGTLIAAHLEPIEGGTFLIDEARTSKEGAPSTAHHEGIWRTIHAPHRFEFDFRTENEEPWTRVNLELKPVGEGCEAKLTHDLAPEYHSYATQVRFGWNTIFDTLINCTPEAPQVIVRRRLPLAPEQVFPHFLNPESLAQWWGPNGFRTITHSMDAREGGTWRFTMIGPDDHPWENKVDYKEIVPNQRIRFEHGDPEAVHFENLIEFTPVGDETEVTLRLTCRTLEQKQTMREFGAIEGGHQTLGRLENHLS